MVATYPRPLSRDASITVPLAALSGLAFSSSSSASNNILSSSSSTFKPLFALISWLWYLPPQLSTRIFIPDSCSFIFSGFAPSLSILFKANIMGTFAACACEMASFVCGITASSAATTITAISVTLAPRARIAVKAS